MKKDNWFRSPDWGKKDQLLFYEKIKRARGNDSRSQYARIKALALLKSGKNQNYESAVELFHQTLLEWPSKYDLDTDGLYAGLGSAYSKLGDYKNASMYFEKIVSQNNSSSRVSCLEYAEMIVVNKLVDLYGRALEVVEKYTKDYRMTFPFEHFVYHAVRAVVFSKTGENTLSKTEADLALECAQVKKSVFRWHPKVGLVEEVRYAKLLKITRKLAR